MFPYFDDAQANLVPAGRAGVACCDEAANDVAERALVDLLSDPVLIDEVSDMHAPRIASRHQGRTQRGVSGPDTWNDCKN
jgi:hypothetical protein